MARISFKDWSKREIEAFYKKNKGNLQKFGVSLPQVLVALLDHTPGFGDLPEVIRAREENDWKEIFGKVCGILFRTHGKVLIDPSIIIGVVMDWDRIPSPNGSPSLIYAIAALKESAVRKHADAYEAAHEDDTGYEDFDFGFDVGEIIRS